MTGKNAHGRQGGKAKRKTLSDTVGKATEERRGTEKRRAGKENGYQNHRLREK